MEQAIAERRQKKLVEKTTLVTNRFRKDKSTVKKVSKFAKLASAKSYTQKTACVLVTLDVEMLLEGLALAKIPTNKYFAELPTK